MHFTFDPSTLAQSLMMTLKGMVGIFVVIGVIMFAIWALNRTSRPKRKD